MQPFSLEKLAEGFFVAVNGVHRFGTDAFLLADFCAAGPGERAMDIGAGCGIIPLIWAKNGKCASVTAVEIQEEAARLASVSADVSGCREKIRVVCADIREYRSFSKAGCLDLVACNPPYKRAGAGLRNPDWQKAAARHEEFCGLDDICAAAAFGLRWGGRLCLCHRPERLTDVFFCMRTFKVEPKKLRLVCRRQGEKPWLALVEGRRGGGNGLDILPPLCMEREDGTPSEELLLIYRGR